MFSSEELFPGRERRHGLLEYTDKELGGRLLMDYLSFK